MVPVSTGDRKAVQRPVHISSPRSLDIHRRFKSINATRGIEKVFGWMQQFGGLRQFKLLRGRDNVSAVFGLHVIAYNLIRLSNILKPAIEVA